MAINTKIQPIIIGAPFGNYIRIPNTTQTIGTFTSAYRGGFWTRVWRALSTVRYYHGIRAWKNRMGLPNPGIASLVGQVHEDKIISVMGFEESDWVRCVETALACRPLAIELNASCPNCPGEDRTKYPETLKRLVRLSRKELILKLPPVGYEKLLWTAVDAGISSFHCCNTLPTPGGGLSGKPLKLLSLRCANDVMIWSYWGQRYKITRLVGGGGVTHHEDADDYFRLGCTNVAVASVLFNPFNWNRIQKIAELQGAMFQPKE